MTKYVLDVGNCVPDHAAIRELIEDNFDAVVLQAHTIADTLATLQQKTIDLLLVNRKLDHDYSDGLKVIERLKATTETSQIPVMMITNFDEHQQHAMRVGAERGFGKLELRDAETLAKLSPFLS